MRKMYCVLTALLTDIAGFGQQAPVWEWDTLVKTENAIALSTDDYGNFYTFGYNDSLYKYNNRRSLVFKIRFYNGEISAVESSTNGNVFVTGLFHDTLRVNGSELICRGEKDIFLCQLSPNGSSMWLKQIGSKKHELAPDIFIRNEIVYLSGSSSDSTYFDDYLFPKGQSTDLFVARYRVNHGFERVDFLISENENSGFISKEIAVDHQQNIILLAIVNGTAHLGGEQLNGAYSNYFIKMDRDFNYQWHYFGGQIMETSYNLLVDNSNNVLFISRHYATHSPGWSCAVRISPDGDGTAFFNPSWGILIGMDIQPDNTLAYSYWTFRWGPQMSYDEYFIHTGFSSNGFFQERTDSSKTISYGGCLRINKYGELFLSQGAGDTVHLKNTITEPGNFIAIMNISRLVGTESLSKTDSYSTVSPNPSSGKFFVSGLPDNSEIKIYDLYGKCLYCTKGQEVDLSAQAKGIYFLEGKNKEGIVRKKLLVE